MGRKKGAARAGREASATAPPPTKKAAAKKAAGARPMGASGGAAAKAVFDDQNLVATILEQLTPVQLCSSDLAFHYNEAMQPLTDLRPLIAATGISRAFARAPWPAGLASDRARLTIMRCDIDSPPECDYALQAGMLLRLRRAATRRALELGVMRQRAVSEVAQPATELALPADEALMRASALWQASLSVVEDESDALNYEHATSHLKLTPLCEACEALVALVGHGGAPAQAEAGAAGGGPAPLGSGAPQAGAAAAAAAMAAPEKAAAIAALGWAALVLMLRVDEAIETAYGQMSALRPDYDIYDHTYEQRLTAGDLGRANMRAARTLVACLRTLHACAHNGEPTGAEPEALLAARSGRAGSALALALAAHGLARMAVLHVNYDAFRFCIDDCFFSLENLGLRGPAHGGALPSAAAGGRAIRRLAAPAARDAAAGAASAAPAAAGADGGAQAAAATGEAAGAPAAAGTEQPAAPAAAMAAAPAPGAPDWGHPCLSLESALGALCGLFADARAPSAARTHAGHALSLYIRGTNHAHDRGELGLDCEPRRALRARWAAVSGDVEATATELSLARAPHVALARKRSRSIGHGRRAGPCASARAAPPAELCEAATRVSHAVMDTLACASDSDDDDDDGEEGFDDDDGGMGDPLFFDVYQDDEEEFDHEW